MENAGVTRDKCGEEHLISKRHTPHILVVKLDHAIDTGGIKQPLS